MTPEDFKRAEELLDNPDYEDCERFASWYGSGLLAVARAQPALVEAVRDLLGIIESVCPEYSESPMCAAAARLALLDAARSEPHDPSSLQKMQTTPQAVGGGAITREAEGAACAAYRALDMGQQWTLEPAMRAALKAALPHLRPSPSYDPTKSLNRGRPIETAPTDGTLILIGRPTDFSDDSHAVVRWDDDWWQVHDGKTDHPLRGPAPTCWWPLPSRLSDAGEGR